MHEAVDAARTGAFLCTLRKARGMTQEQVAEALCVSNKTISKWESGAGLPDITILPDLAEFYGVTADDLLAGQRLQSAERTAGTRQKHRARLYRRAEFRLTVLGLCMAVLPLCALLLGSLFSGLYDSTVLGLRGVALLTALFSLLAVLGLNYGGLQLREGLADLEDPDGGLLSRLALRQKRFLALTLAAVCGCCWQLLGSHPQYFLAVTGLSGADGNLRASLLDGARCGLLLLALLAVFLVLGRRGQGDDGDDQARQSQQQGSSAPALLAHLLDQGEGKHPAHAFVLFHRAAPPFAMENTSRHFTRLPRWTMRPAFPKERRPMQ